MTVRPNLPSLKGTQWYLAFLSVPILILFFVTSLRFDGLYGQDPYAYFHYAIGPLREGLRSGCVFPPFFWPPGYPLVVLLASLLVGARPLAGQIISALAGAAVPILVALLAGRAWARHEDAREVALLSGLAATFVGQLWQSSVVVMADTVALAAATFGVWALMHYGDYPVNRLVGKSMAWLVVATASVSFAVLSRWAFGLIAIPCAVYTVWVASRRDKRLFPVWILVAALATVLMLSPVLPDLWTILLGESGEGAAFVGDFQTYSWHPRNMLSREFNTPDGLLAYRLPNGLYYLLAPAHWYYFTPVLAPLLLVGFGSVLRRMDKNLALLLGWAACVYIFHAGAPWQNFRFTLSYLPPLAIILALGANALLNLARGRWVWLARSYLICGVLLMGVLGWGLVQRFVETKNGDLETVRWVERQIPDNSRLVTFNLTLTFRHYSDLETLELYELGKEDREVLANDGGPVYLLLDVSNVEAQWEGLSPDRNFQWFRTQPGFSEIGIHRRYHLFRVLERFNSRKGDSGK